MAWDANSPTLSRLVGSGCLTCPTGSRVAPDDGLGALETLAKNVLTLNSREFDAPDFPLSELPVKAAQSKLIGGDDVTTEYDYHIPNLQDIVMHNPNPTREVASRVVDAMNNCGPDSIASTMMDMSSLFCNPPRGKTGVMGKDSAPITSAAVPLEMGPFCVTQFQNFDHLAAAFRRMEAYYPNALMQIINYQKMRDFVGSCYNLGAATAGSTKPRWNEFAFGDRPNSVGSLTWFSEAIDHIVAFASSREGWSVSMSRRLWRRWVEDYAKAKGVTLNADIAMLNQQIGEYYLKANSASEVTLTTDRRNITITINLNKEPVYIVDNQIGSNLFEWNFQPYWQTRAGDDARSGEAAGYVRDMNPDYGSACSSCADGMQSLSEMIFIYNGESHCYEAFPENPFAGMEGLSDLNASVQAIVGSMNLRYYFGAEVQRYFLDPLYAVAGKSCPLNIDNTWFAGRIWAAFRQRLLRKRASGALLVKVPNDGMKNTEEIACAQEEYPTPIIVNSATLEGGSRECVPEPDAPTDPTGCLRPPAYYTIVRPEEDTVIELEVDRVSGLAGTPEVDYATSDGTATEPDDYTAAAGTLAFVEGQTRGVVEITIKGGACVESDPGTSQLVVDWSGDDICDGANTQTIIYIEDRLCADGETPS